MKRLLLFLPVILLTCCGADTNAPPKLLSQPHTNAVERIPVYVIPEAIAVKTPMGVFVFADQHHVMELTRKFPAQKLTNIVIWNQ